MERLDKLMVELHKFYNDLISEEKDNIYLFVS